MPPLHTSASLALLLLALSAPAARACGGFFPQEPQALTLDADRVLYVSDEDRTHIMAQVSWGGAPSEFAWLLPVPPDAEVGLSTPDLFYWLDAQLGASFQIHNDYLPGCEAWTAAFDAGVPFEGGEVRVISQAVLGPYEQTLIEAAEAEILVDWLRARGYAVPEGTAARLQPYLDQGLAVLALRLSPEAESYDLRPLHIQFAPRPLGMHLQLSALGARPDTAVIIHALGEARLAPSAPFLHVEINPALIDWRGKGSNYLDVIAEAIDEAGGLAFATDYAGPVEAEFEAPLSEEALARVAEAETLEAALQPLYAAGAYDEYHISADLQRALRATLTLPEGMPFEGVLDCLDCYGDLALDGAALAQRLADEYNPPRAFLSGALSRHRYITRMLTVISPQEMEADPRFVFNPDLPTVRNIHVATREVTCEDFSADYDGAAWILPDGRRLEGGLPTPLRRVDEARATPGEPAALRVTRMGPTGAEEVISTMTPEETPDAGPSTDADMGIAARGDSGLEGGARSADGDEGGCHAFGGARPLSLGLLALLGLLSLLPRRRAR
ncbi:DUF2330 domain-containing protein [Myxococcota bacterium]|nr:DUF2330 domain-containing protein [Myxococcota bacterium]MBU1433275.1 DUF2330 domain-containing protein [Myxococcota bacterium]MBU1897265.1 DUF2330 domain-containing protein [Myxococcota bacterium]